MTNDDHIEFETDVKTNSKNEYKRGELIYRVEAEWHRNEIEPEFENTVLILPIVIQFTLWKLAFNVYFKSHAVIFIETRFTRLIASTLSCLSLSQLIRKQVMLNFLV